MKILFTKFPLESHFGGGEKHTIQLASLLINAGHQVNLLSSDPILLQEWQRAQWPHQKISVGPEPTSPKSLLLFSVRLPVTLWQFAGWARKIKQNKTDLVYAQSLTEKLLLTPWLLLANIPVIWMEHLQIENWLRRNPYLSLYRWLSRRVTVVTVSQGVAAQLAEIGVPQHHIKVIYNGIDVREFMPSSHPANNPIVLGTAARIAIEKDIATVLTALAAVKKNGHQFRYKIAGTGDQLESLKAQAKQLGLEKEVEFLGFQQDIKQFLQAIDIFILTSFRRESFGIAVAEAMATGKPAIVSDIAGLQEVVDNGNTGIVVPPQDSQALAMAITELLTDDKKRQAMGKASRQRIVENFSQERMITEFVTLFETTASKSIKG